MSPICFPRASYRLEATKLGQRAIRVHPGLTLCAGVGARPALRAAVARATALIGLIGRFVMAVLWASAGGVFLWIALFEAAFAILLAWLIYKYMAAELMSRP